MKYEIPNTFDLLGIDFSLEKKKSKSKSMEKKTNHRFIGTTNIVLYLKSYLAQSGKKSYGTNAVHPY